MPLHRKRMLDAFTASAVFLVSYLIRFATTGAHKYPGDGFDKIIYLIMLFTPHGARGRARAAACSARSSTRSRGDVRRSTSGS